MKIKKWLVALITALVAVFGIATVAACGKGDENPETPEAGVYYYDAEGTEYTIELYDGNLFSFSVRGADLTGKYSITEEGLKLDFSEKGQKDIIATLGDNFLQLTYDSSSMRFLKKVDYTVDFQTDGGSAVGDVTVLNGKTVSRPADPTREGWYFLGWFTDAAHTQPFLFDTAPVSADTTLYAKWEQRIPGIAEYTLDFDLGYPEGETIAPKLTANGKLLEAPVPAARSGYTFRGWWISMYEKSDRLSFRWTEDYIFDASSTLFAVWTENNSAPLVTVGEDAITWESTGAAVNYTYSVTGPEGFNGLSGQTGSTSVSVDFASYPAGDYTISVAANGGEPTLRYYHNKALARVSLFTVVEPSTLVFNAVKGAQHYYITVECGDPGHKHEMLDNFDSTNFNFLNCPMTANGIKFTVTAAGAGYASSVSETFVYVRTLAPVSGLHVEDDDLLVWDAVPNAVDYVVSVACSDGTHEHAEVNTNGKTFYSLKDCAAGNITVNVYPKTNGYNSPSATQITYEKKSLAAPRDLRIEGNTLSWSQVTGATGGYDVNINGKNYPATTNSLDLSTAGIEWSALQEYVVTVRAKGDVNSPWSDPCNLYYHALSSGLSYSHNLLTWPHVVGALRYEVRVNDGKITEVEGGRNYLETALTKAGENVLYVRYFDGTTFSDWASVTVTAYAVEFNPLSGTPVDPVYVAYGDKVTLPESTREGYKLSGWYNAPGGAAGNGAEYLDETFTGIGPMMLYANWTPEQYTITYFADDAAGTSGSATVTYGEPFEFEVPSNTDTSYNFYGWYSHSDGSGTPYTDRFGKGLDVWSVAGDVTVYAYWANVLDFDPVEEGGKTGFAVRQGPGIAVVDGVRIPETHDGQPVLVIDALAFRDCTNLKSIEIPDSVEVIASNAFYNCTGVTGYTVYESSLVSDHSQANYYSDGGAIIERFADDDSHTRTMRLVFFPVGRTGSYTVPDGVWVLPERVFAGAVLTSVTIPASVKTIEPNAFYQTRQLQTVTFIAAKSGEAADGLSVAGKAFYYCDALEEITFPAHLNELGDGVTFATIFTNCGKLARLNIEEGNQHYASIDGIVTDAEKETILFCPRSREGVFNFAAFEGTTVKAIGASAFDNCSKITEIIFPGFITSIGEGAFRNCTAIETITFKGDVVTGDVTIGKAAFSGGGITGQRACTALTTVTFEEGSKVKEIGEQAFMGCFKLEAIVLPSTVRAVGKEAFKDCSGLLTATIDGSSDENDTTTFGTNVFQNCTNLAEVHISKNVKDFPSGIFAGCTNLATVTVADDSPYLKVWDGVLYDHEITKIIWVPLGRTGAFTIPDTVTEIGANIFNNTGFTELIIPNSVTKIAYQAFRAMGSLQKVTFEEGGEEELVFGTQNASSNSGRQFDDCEALVEMHLPARVKKIPEGFVMMTSSTTSTSSWTTLGNHSALTTVTIGDEEHPSQLEYIGKGAFIGCAHLTEFVIPDTVTYIGDYAFANTAIKNITLKEGIEYGARTYYWSLYYDYLKNDLKLTDEDIADSQYDVTFTAEEGVTTIPEYVVYQSSGTSLIRGEITIPKSVTTIGAQAFGSTKITKLTFEEGGTELTIGASLLSACNSLEEIHFPAHMTAWPTTVFGSGGGVKPHTVTFGDADHPSQLTEIGKDAFKGNSNLTTLEIPSTVKTIGDTAFSATTGLTSLTLPEGLTTIGKNAFMGSGLTAIELPKTITSLAEGPFQNCLQLESVTFAADYAYNAFPDSFFSGCTAFDTIDVPDCVTTIGKNAFSGTALTEITLPGALTSIGNTAFQNCTELKTVTFGTPEEGTEVELTIGSTTSSTGSVFKGCTQLESVTFGAKTVIGMSAFEGITALHTVNFGKNEITVLESAFEGTELGELSIPGNVKTIGQYAFKDAKITALTLGEGVETIGEYAFSGNEFTEVKLPSTLKATAYDEKGKFSEGFAPSAFFDCASLTTITVEDGGAYSAASGALYLKDEENGSTLVYVPEGFEGTAEIPNTVSKIGAGAFFNSKISGLTFADGGTFDLVIEGNTISANEHQGAFQNTSFTTVEFPARLTTLGDYAFFEAKIQTVTFKSSAEEPSRLSVIGMCAFNGSELEHFTFPEYSKDNVTLALGTVYKDGSCSGDIFRGTKLAGEISIPANVTHIGSNTFRDLAITKVEIAENSKLAYIGQYAFSSTAELTTFEFKGTVIAETFQIATRAFENSGITAFTVPAQTTTIAAAAFEGTSDLASVTFLGVNAEDSKLTKIENNTFKGSGIKSLVLPEGITSIGTSAFEDCAELSGELVLPDTIQTIAYGAFAKTGISKVTLPKNLTQVDGAAAGGTVYGAFAACPNLQEVVFQNGTAKLAIACSASVPQGGIGTSTQVCGVFSSNPQLQKVTLSKNIVAIANFTFANCGALETVQFGEDDSEVADSMLATIGASAFINCTSLAKFTVPAGVKSFGNYSFGNCTGLEEITLGAGVPAPTTSVNPFWATPSTSAYLPSYAFAGCTGLQNIKVADGNPALQSKEGVLFSKDGSTLYVYPMGKEGDYTVPDGTATIFQGAFYKHKKIQKLTIAGTVTCIQNYALAGGNSVDDIGSLSEVIFAEGTADLMIGSGTTPTPVNTTGRVFAYTSLTTLKLPARTKYLCNYLAHYSPNLKTFELEEGCKVEKLPNYSFSNCTALTTVTLPEGTSLKEICSSAFASCTALETFHLPSTISILGSTSATATSTNVFQKCTALREVTFGDEEHPSQLTMIHKQMFESTAIKEITIPASVTTICQGAFANCLELETVNFASGTATLTFADGSSGSTTGSTAGVFAGCTALKTFVFPARAAKIANRMFFRAGIEEFTFEDHATVTTVGSSAFDTATIDTIELPDSVKEIQSIAFSRSTIRSIGLGKVETISSSAFANCQELEEISIPNTVTTFGGTSGMIFQNDAKLQTVTFEAGGTLESIGDTAFTGCKGLKTVTLPEKLKTIGKSSFLNNTSLTAIKMPDTVTELGTDIFNGCEQLADVTLSQNITSIPDNMFRNNYALADIVLPTSVESIGNSAFLNAGLTKISLTRGLVSIGDSAFSGCTKLEKLTVPNTVRELGNNPFYGVQSVEFEQGNTYYYMDSDGALLGNNQTVLLSYPTSKTGSYTVPSTVTEIAADAFRKTALTDITIPASVTTIGATAFADSTSLRNVIFTGYDHLEEGQGLISLGSAAFQNDVELQRFEIPSTLKTIPTYAFDGCTGLTNVTFHDEIITISSWSFRKTSSLAIELTIGEKVTVLGSNAFEGSGITSVDIKGVPPLGLNSETFKDCKSLKTAKIAEGITAMGTTSSSASGIFSGCVELTEVTVPESLISMGKNAFYGCTSLQSFTAEGLTTLGDYAFYGCTSLKTVNIPKVVDVSNYAFYGCTELTDVTLQKETASRFYFRLHCFDGCEKLKSTVFPTTVASSSLIDAYAFAGTKALGDVTIVTGFDNMNAYAFYQSGVKTVTFEGDININTNKEGSAYGHQFAECHDLTKVTFVQGASKTTTMPNGLFQNCEKLATIENLNAKPQKIESSVFEGCVALTSLTFESVSTIDAEAFKGLTQTTTITFGIKESEIPARTASNTGWHTDWRKDCNANIVFAPEDGGAD